MNAKSLIQFHPEGIERAMEELRLSAVSNTIKGKELIDSMLYAQYIQESIFGKPENFVWNLPLDSFLLYRPKDIVGGDFYWTYRILNKQVVAVGDCTGHGIPGAMLTLLANNALNRTVIENRTTCPGDILHHLNRFFVEAFGHHTEDIDVGMDMAICSIDMDGRSLEYAGARNPLWLVRNRQLTEFKGERSSIGSANRHFPEYKTVSIDLHKDDVVYLFSDGYMDQFGGSDKRKFMRKRFRALLASNSHQDMEVQKYLLENGLDLWQGDLEQIDDICVLGMRF